MKHTPGPWAVDTIETGTEYTNNVDQLVRISFPKISIKKHAEKNGEQLQEEYASNELLIAAAPDLLEALEGVLPYVAMGASAMQRHSIREKAMKAIAKAKGETILKPT